MARRHATLIEVLEWRAREQRDETAFTFLNSAGEVETRWTYGELMGRAQAIGAVLLQADATDKCVLLLFPSGLEYIAAFFGCLFARAIAVPVYPPRANRSIARLTAIAEDAKATIALTTRAIRARMNNLSSECSPLSGLQFLETDGLVRGTDAVWDGPKASADSVAFLQYTSGSTATPKGVVLRHRHLLHNERMMAEAFDNRERFSCAGWLPLYHDMGLIGNVLQPIYLGARCVLMAPETFLMRPIRWLEAISKYRVTTSGGPNFAYDLCVDRTSPEQRKRLDLSSWTVAFNGAEPVRATTIERFSAAFLEAGFRRECFRPCYGLAEATLLVATGDALSTPRSVVVDSEALERGIVRVAGENGNGHKSATPTRRIVSCGKTWASTEVSIVDPETERFVEPGRVGEIWVSGPSVAGGYFGRSDATRHTFMARVPGGNVEYLRTGDLGFMDGGELFVTGRIKDLIIIAGRNVYPQDLERICEDAHESVRSGCVAAFQVDIDGSERVVIAAEVDRRGPTHEAIETAIRNRLSAEEAVVPHAVVFLRQGTIPRTSSGKIQRHACKEAFLRATFERAEASTAESSRTKEPARLHE